MRDYPKLFVSYPSTPAETFYVCDSCPYSCWYVAVPINHPQCPRCKGRKGGSKRLRVASANEKAAAQAAIKSHLDLRVTKRGGPFLSASPSGE